MKNALEKSVDKRAQRRGLQKQLTLLLARLTGEQGRSLFVSNSVLLKRLHLPEERINPSYRVRQALRRMEQRGLVVQDKNEAGWSVQLTSKGRTVARKAEMHEYLISRKPADWDGRWRLVIFDIFERRKATRDQLRRALISAGFRMLQGSIWVYPYDCEDLLVFLRADLRLGSGMLYIIAEGIEGDGWLRSHFGLN